MKKGFTLVELLAVIVILVVIAVITTPIIIGVVEETRKGALKSSAYGLIESADLYYAEKMEEGNVKTEFTFLNGEQTSAEKLAYKGKVEEGSLRLYSDGKIALCIAEGKNIAIKNVNEEEVQVKEGRCSYNSTTEEYEALEVCQDLKEELKKVKEQYEEEKEQLRKDYEAQKETIENTYKDEIQGLEKQIAELQADFEDQKATIEEAYKQQIEGLENRIKELEQDYETDLEQAAKDYQQQMETQKEAYESQIAELNKQITDKENTIASLNTQLNTFKTGGTAKVGEILTGKTAYVQGNLITGTIPSKTGSSVATKVSQSNNKIYMVFPYGYYPSGEHFSTANSSEIYADNSTVASAIGLQAAQIATGQTVLGVSGTYTNDATATASDISFGKTAYVKGELVTGTHENSLTYVATLDYVNNFISLSEHNLTGKTADDFVLVVKQGTLSIYISNNTYDMNKQATFNINPSITIDGDKLTVNDLHYLAWYSAGVSYGISITVDLYVK